MSANNIVVLFAGGGTAGHLLPAMATEEALDQYLGDLKGKKLKSIYLATATGAELSLLKSALAQFHLVPKTDFPRKISLDLLTFFPRVVIAVARTRRIIKSEEVDVVLGFGGYVALPAYCAAAISRVPIVIHEANALPGLANRFGKFLATKAFASFPINGWDSKSVIGLPVRKSISALAALAPDERLTLKRDARIFFGLEPNRKTILIFGGSLGAARINEATEGAIGELISRGFQILHSVGAKNHLPELRPHYHPVPFIAEMNRAYLVADVVVARSGAGTCAEIAATGLPAVLVPLNIGNGEQLLNAQALAKKSAISIIENDELSSEQLIAAIELRSQDSISFLSSKKPASEILAEEVIKVVSKSRTKRVE
jgi:UDP-N-acetylglucosamine--N-acetylmuramyl-(pentapeptide) pyrophosphoryl-undecaprenol N-acetylglucosamine transferase